MLDQLRGSGNLDLQGHGSPHLPADGALPLFRYLFYLVPITLGDESTQAVTRVVLLASEYSLLGARRVA